MRPLFMEVNMNTRQSINFDEGYKEYEINGDSERVIRVDTADYGLIERFKKAEKHINDELKKYENIKIKADGSADTDDETAAQMIADLGEFIKNEINYIFNADVSEIVFGNASPLSTRKGVPLYERFVNAVLPVIEADLKAEAKASEKRVSQYTKQAQQFKGKKK